MNGPVKMDQVGAQNLTKFSSQLTKGIEVKLLPSINNLIANSLHCVQYLQKVNIVHRTQDVYRFVIWCILCKLGPFLLAQSYVT